MKHAVAVSAFFAALFIAYFSPVIFSSRLLPSDGQLASFHSRPELWTNFLWGGFPAAADPQWESWYPLSRVYSLLPHGFNAFMVSAYVLAAGFTYGYIFTVTGSRLGALIGGTTFSMSGFMMAHLGHTAIIHAALWLPLIIWAFEKLRSEFSAQWFVAGVLAIAGSILGGHLQVSVYAMALAVAYVVGMGPTAKADWCRYLFRSTAVLILGCALAAVQLVPTLELASLSFRTKMVFSEFVSYSLPPFQLIELLFPYLFGGSSQSPYQQPYFGEWNLAELAGYAGLVTVMLAAIGVWCWRRDRTALFWSATAVVALLLALGSATPLATLMYHVPLINKFRAPARHLLELELAIAVLAGLGVRAIQAGKASTRGVVGLVVAAGALLMASSALFFHGRVAGYAAARGVVPIPAVRNPAVIVPLLVFLLAAFVLLYWSRRRESWARAVLLLGVVVVDLGSCGWFYDWRYHATSDEILNPPTFVGGLRHRLDDSKQRVLQMEWAGGPPDMFRIYKLPSLNGYGPLMIQRVAELSGVTTSGSVQPIALQAGNQGVDLLAARYVLRVPPTTIRAHGIEWSRDDLALDLGEGCGQRNSTHAEFRLTEPVRATRVAVVSTMGCSTSISNNEPVLRLSFEGDDGGRDERVLHAGRDTSEWAVDCDGVKSAVRHRRAPIFSSWSSSRGTGECRGHNYLTTLELPGRRYNRIRLEWSGAPGVMNIAKISLIDDGTKGTYVVSPFEGSLDDTGRFRLAERAAGILVYENVRALPRAWLVSEVVSAESDDILKAIRTSVLPDGRPFDPRRVALVEEPFSFKTEDGGADAAAEVVKVTNTSLRIRTRARAPRFLVMSDIYYPGWKASINGFDVHLFRTNYVLRGVMLPAGTHTVQIEFRPLSVYLGGLVSGLGVVMTLVVAGLHLRGRRGPRSRPAGVEGRG